MPFVICEKHNKQESSWHKLAVYAYVCMNKYCPQSTHMICDSCKPQHKDHSNKILNLEDISFLVERLIKTQPRSLNQSFEEAVDVMKKLRLIKEFKKKLDILEAGIEVEVLNLIQLTENVLAEIDNCAKGVQQLSVILGQVRQQKGFMQFKKRGCELLGLVDYNFKKEKLQYGNQKLKEKEDKRKKCYELQKRKIQEVKDYCMKIIQVILHNDDDSSSEEEDSFYNQKHYELLKKELQIECKIKKNNQSHSEFNDKSSKKHLGLMKTHRKQQINQIREKEETQTVKELKGQLEQIKQEFKAQISSQKEQLENTLEKLQKEQIKTKVELQARRKVQQQKLKQQTQLKKALKWAHELQTALENNAEKVEQKDVSMETNNKWIMEIQANQEKLKDELNRAKMSSFGIEDIKKQLLEACKEKEELRKQKQQQLKDKEQLKKDKEQLRKDKEQHSKEVYALQKEKQYLQKQIGKMKAKQLVKNQKLLEIEEKMRKNKHERAGKLTEQQQLLQKIMELAGCRHQEH